MTIGPRIGVAVGPRIGLAPGVSSDPIVPPTGGVLVGVTRDATSGIYCPANATEWQIVYTAAGLNPSLIPTSTWSFQEASGNLADGQSTFTLTASGTGITYQVAEAGWTRKSITTTENGTGVFKNTDVGLIDISVGSCALLAYVRPTTSGTARSIFGMGPAATRCAAERNLTTGVPMIRCGANTGTGVNDPSAAIRPWWLGIDRNASAAALYTDQEKIIPTFSGTAAGQQITFGILQTNDSTCSYNYAAMFTGNGAQLSAAQVKTLLQTLAWTIPWT